METMPTMIKQRIRRRMLEKKKRLDAHRPLHPDLVKRIKERALVEYVHSSNAVEGNTLTLGETEAVIKGMTIGGKTIVEHLEVINHPEAIHYVEELARADVPITEETIRKVHGILLDKILQEPGEYRTGMITVPGANFTPPRSSEIPGLMRELVTWLEGNPDEHNPVELAARFMHRLLVIHPFHDGNGRTARILMNLVLMRHGYPFLTNISYRDRKKYLETLGEADLDHYEPFLNFIATSVEESLTKYLAAIEELELLTMRQAATESPYTAEYLGLRARDGSLGAFKDGRNWKVTREDLHAYVSEMKSAQ